MPFSSVVLMSQVSRRPLLCQARFSQAVENLFKVGRVIVRQGRAPMFQRVLRIDAQRFTPFRLALHRIAHVPVEGGQQDAADVGLGFSYEASLQRGNTLLILFELQMRQGEKVQIYIPVVRVEAHGFLQGDDGITGLP